MGERLRRLRDFFVELKRRRVYRTAAVYVAVAAGTIELVDVLLPYTRLPDWTVGLVFVVAGCAFPVVLVLAWTFDVTGRIERTAEGPKATSGTVRSELDPRFVAVLPFDTLSGAESVAPLAAGLHDDLLTALSRIPELTVISRTSVKGYRGTDKRIGQIARELGVGTVVEGAVQSAGGRVRLNVQLIDAREDAHRWAETYDRELSAEDIFEIQSDLSRKIVESLHAELATPEPGVRARPATDDLEAYRLYAQGQTWLDQRTPDGMARARSYFRKAIERDPGHAPAWAGLAETLTLMDWYDFAQPGDEVDPEHAARKAVELDPGLAEGYTSLGILHSLKQDGPAALRELTRAVELRPGYAEAQIWLAWLCVALGRAESALEPAWRSVELNPLSPVVRVFTAQVLLAVGRAEEALEHSRSACALQPGFALAQFMDALVRYHLGQTAEARKILTRILSEGSLTANPRPTQVRAALALTRIASGDAQEARQELSRIEKWGAGSSDSGAGSEESRLEFGESGAGSPDPFATGLVRAALGERDQAFQAFDDVPRWQPTETEQIRYFFPDVLGPLREDSRWEEVIRDVDRSWGMDGPAGFDSGGSGPATPP